MSTPEKVKQQIDGIVCYLVEVGLASDQNFGYRRDGAQGSVEITFPQAEHTSIALKDQAYRDIYHHLARERSFNVMLPDGALVQMMYAFSGGGLERHDVVAREVARLPGRFIRACLRWRHPIR